ncbi:hypothetical protein SAMN05216475_1695 [Pseudomonas synxantha]|uniref:Phage protein n=1 Tax=Pseudomonas synxantha TaxID=47883 RepID=A0AAX3I5F5_9PSED|nr:hypothetical protein [Pseudomonas synxantha]AZE67647.1 hypothetical protein C4K01_3454 [Pseudomonas synxantha]KRP43678.1 hypothetical protein TU77_29815 [Pseudomonas synxantha]SDU20778.1 hypothetical protein SAMN05216475_1695 [Pseudomonas synxantha]VTQ98042.1 Uncharacterised protein [Pseudomonas synxantha]
MLKDPFLNEPFDPSLMWFIGTFDIYDREQGLGMELAQYDPNKKSDRKKLIINYALNLKYLSYRHKHALIESLKNKLKDEKYNFDKLFEIDENETGSWPRAEWYALDDPRGFLMDIYILAQAVWKEDLQKASLEDPSTW